MTIFTKFNNVGHAVCNSLSQGMNTLLTVNFWLRDYINHGKISFFSALMFSWRCDV